MRRRRHGVAAFAALLLTAVLAVGLGVAAAQGGEARLRVAQLIPAETALRVRLEPERGDAPAAEWTLDYGRTGDERAFEPGLYRLTVARPDGGAPLLEARWGLGLGGRYTLTLFGLAPDEPTPRPWFDRVRALFGGEVAIGYGSLPQSVLLDDRVSAGAQRARLRVLHAAPTRSAWTLRARRDGRERVLAAGLGYAARSSEVALEPGAWEVDLSPAGSPLRVRTLQLDLRPGELVTLVAAGSGVAGDPFEIVVLRASATGR